MHRAANQRVFGMAPLQLCICYGVARDPSDMGNANYVAVQIGLKNTRSTGIGIDEIRKFRPDASIKPGLDLSRLLKMLSVSVHLSQHRADSIVLDA